jgi:hypothetical protein
MANCSPIRANSLPCSERLGTSPQRAFEFFSFFGPVEPMQALLEARECRTEK